MKNNFFRLMGVLALAVIVSACGLRDAPSAVTQAVNCEVSPRLPDHPVAAQMVAPVGDYPVWFVTIDSSAMSELGESLPPYNGRTVAKSLMVVSTELEGDLVITGRQIDGDAVVLFPLRIDEETVNDEGERVAIYSEDDLVMQRVIPNAQITTNSTWSNDYASHPWAAYYPMPGCYQLSAIFGGYTTNIIVEIRDE
jgi:hypothetical protein